MTAADLVPAAEAAWFTLGLACLRSRRLDPARAEPALGDLAGHWQHSLRLFAQAQARWFADLQERGEVDPADRRNRLFRQVAERWRVDPPRTPVVAAGVTSAAKGLAALLRRIAPWFPGSLLVVAAASAAVATMLLPVDTIQSRFGALPLGWPSPSLPHVSIARISETASSNVSLSTLPSSIVTCAWTMSEIMSSRGSFSRSFILPMM